MWNKIVFVLFAQKVFSWLHKITVDRLMSHGLLCRSSWYFSGPWSCKDPCCLWEGLRALRFKQKYLNLCSEDEQRSYGFGTTSGLVINDIIFIFVWTNPLIFQGFEGFASHMINIWLIGVFVLFGHQVSPALLGLIKIIIMNPLIPDVLIGRDEWVIDGHNLACIWLFTRYQTGLCHVLRKCSKNRLWGRIIQRVNRLRNVFKKTTTTTQSVGFDWAFLHC